jgi:hypothetical protein
MRSKKKLINNFIKINTQFWQKFQEYKSFNKFCLIETSGHPVVNHANAIVGKAIAQAKNLRIMWINYGHTNKKLMKSYAVNSVFMDLPKISILTKLWFFTLSIFYYFTYVLFKNKLLSFKFNGIPYGDFIYDNYLAEFSLGTLHRLDPRITIIFLKLLLNDARARNIFKQHVIKAIVVSHYTGLKTGPLSRVAMQRSIPVYWKGGGHKIINLNKFQNLNQIYNYPNKPTNEIINLLVNKYKAKIEEDFKQLINNSQNSPFYNTFSVAYKNKIFTNTGKQQFLQKMNLSNKPLIFVMLHAFNDHPHSHFKNMLFNDYYDWFRQTLDFTYKEKAKNWIFKEHPANKYYPTKDISFKKIMKNLPNNIRFISRNNNIKTSTVLNVADLIVTCLGSAGIEMPALKGIPSVIAGDTFYDELGFTIKPKTRQEYFQILKQANPPILSNKQQLRAKACFLYLRKYCMLPFSAGPAITMEENKNPKKLLKSYLSKVIKEYKINKLIIEKEFIDYKQRIKKNYFINLF